MTKCYEGDTKTISKNGISEKIDSQYLPKNYLDNIFGKELIGESDVKKINSLLEENSTERYSQFLATAIEHKDLIRLGYCSDIITYLRALKFVSYHTAGCSHEEAYRKSHLDNREVVELALSKSPTDKEELRRQALLFAKSKIVAKLQEQLDIPYYLMFAGYGYQAIEVLHKEMREASLAKDRIQAADRLLAHIEPKLEQMNNIQVNVNTGESKSIVDSYKEALLDFTKQQLDLIKQDKENVKQIINVTPKGEEND